MAPNAKQSQADIARDELVAALAKWTDLYCPYGVASVQDAADYCDFQRSIHDLYSRFVALSLDDLEASGHPLQERCVDDFQNILADMASDYIPSGDGIRDRAASLMAAE